MVSSGLGIARGALVDGGKTRASLSDDTPSKQSERYVVEMIEVAVQKADSGGGRHFNTPPMRFHSWQACPLAHQNEHFVVVLSVSWRIGLKWLPNLKFQ